MFDLTRHPRLLKLLSFWDRGRAFLQKRDAGRRAADRQLGAFYARVWREAAAQLGADIEDLGDGVFEIRLGELRTRVQQNTTAMDDLATHCVVRTKPVIYKLLERSGLPTPGHLAFAVEDMSAAVEFLKTTDRACVIKPAAGTGGGMGVTTNIRTPWQLGRAAFAAARHGGDLLIEEQIEGDNYRLLYLDGKLIDAVVRRPPTVIGDGKSTILRLVQGANAARAQNGSSHGLLSIDFDMKRTLARHGLSLNSVPGMGTTVIVKTAINENCGLDNVTAAEMLCPSIIRDGAEAAAIAGIRLAGVDVVTRDPGVPLRESGGVFLEVNSPPGYYWHYHKRDGAFPVAVHVLECLLGTPKTSDLCLS